MRVLLVDHDPAAMENVARALRGVVQLECVCTKADALARVRKSAYDVLIACERVGDGSGLDLLGRIGKNLPDMERIFAAAPERLQLLGPRLNPFKVAHAIAYPIDLEQLWMALAAVAGGVDTSLEETIEHVVLDETGQPPVSPRPVRETRPRDNGNHGGAATARKLAPLPDQPPVSLPQRTTRTPPAVANAGARQPTPIKAPAVAAWAPRMDSGQVDSAAAAAAAAAAQAIYADKTPSSPARHFDVRLPLAIATAVAAAALVGYLLLRRETPAAVTSPQVSTPAIVSIPEQVTTPAPLPSDASASVASAVGAAVAVEDPRIATLQTAIEAALTRDDLTAASQALGELTRLVPQHPRLAFLTAAIQRTRDGRKRASVTTPAAATLPTLTQFTGRTLEESRTPPIDSRVDASVVTPPTPRPPPRLEEIGPAAPNRSSLPAVPTPAEIATPAPQAARPQPAAAAVVLTPARATRRVNPTYPTDAAQRGLEGYAVVAFTVTADGQVRDPRVLESNPPRTFDAAARDAVRRWEFQPALENGVAVESASQTRIEFKLQE